MHKDISHWGVRRDISALKIEASLQFAKKMFASLVIALDYTPGA